MLDKIIHCAMLIALALSCASCASLKCEHFPGERELIADKGLSGRSIWKFGTETFHVQTVNPNKVIASWVKWDEATATHTLESVEVVLSKLDETLFLNLRKDGLYTILRVVPAGEHEVVLLTIDNAKVDADFEKGAIKGNKKGGEFTLECSKEELEAYVRANLNTLFSLKASGVLKLIEGKYGVVKKLL
ncbi:MAG: hypothetical protein PHO37_09765 [Kiritimatiellae bacterium]|nr:hypothetical protein [Kiritimatiellia bacterium]